ncbi:MAG: beta-phosphoglucomutase [Clostridia bacterium]|nr:beta-phosphoglucomutase [Clostridia bacterium]
MLGIWYTIRAVFDTIKYRKVDAAVTKAILGVIFDLDGVIVSTDNCHYLAWKKMADEEGIPFDRTINERLRGVSRMESLSIILEKATKVYTETEKEAMATRKNGYYVELIGSLTPSDMLPGAMDTLHMLKSKGIKIAIGSSSRNTPIILKQIQLDNAFDAVADGNAITHSKPDPEVFLLAAKLLGLSPDNCLVVEDADAGVEAALAGGMRVLGVGGAAQNPKATFSAGSLAEADFHTILNEQ